MSRIAIIPARGGSKRIPRKNIKPFAGKPMIAYAIDAALRSQLFDQVIVSTDDDEIADVARRSGASIPFVRPADLSDDHTPTVPVVAHAIEACEAMGMTVDMACCIYACVPFIEVDDLHRALERLHGSEADYAFPVTEFPSAIQRALRRDAGGRMSPFHPEYTLVRTQDLEPAYYDVGQFYWGRRTAWMSNPRIHASGVGLPIPGWRVADIDTPDDWLRAEALHRSLQQGSAR